MIINIIILVVVVIVVFVKLWISFYWRRNHEDVGVLDGVGVGGGLGRLCRRQRKSGLHGTQGESRGVHNGLKLNEINAFISWTNTSFP